MRRLLYIILAASIVVVGHAYAGDDYVPEDGTPIAKGVGFQGAIPSYLVGLKVVDRHSGDCHWYGSGSFIGSRLVLTCNHNVEDMPEDGVIRILTTTGYVYRSVRVVHQDKSVDLALLKVEDALVLYHRNITVEDTNHTPRHVSSAGLCPKDSGYSLYGGVMGNYLAADTKDGPNVYRSSSCYLEPGMSGGPLINENLHLHGIMVWRHETNEKVPKFIRSFFVRLPFIQKFLDSYDGPFEEEG